MAKEKGLLLRTAIYSGVVPDCPGPVPGCPTLIATLVALTLVALTLVALTLVALTLVALTLVA